MTDSLFISQILPMNWAAQIAMFGEEVEYWPEGDGSQAAIITVIWKDGAADEDLSPGRYAHATVQNADLGDQPPRQGDSIIRNGTQYDIARVNAYTILYSNVVVQAVGETLMATGPKLKVKVKQSGRMKQPNLSDPQLKHIGDAMVAAQKLRWSKAIDASGNAAKKLSTKYAIAKGSYLRKHGTGGRGAGSAPKRDMRLSGKTIANFTLRRAANNTIRAENTTRDLRQRATRAQAAGDMIGFAGSDLKVVFAEAQKEYGQYLTRAWVPLKSTG